MTFTKTGLMAAAIAAGLAFFTSGASTAEAQCYSPGYYAYPAYPVYYAPPPPVVVQRYYYAPPLVMYAPRVVYSAPVYRSYGFGGGYYRSGHHHHHGSSWGFNFGFGYRH